MNMIGKSFRIYKNHGLKPALKAVRDVLLSGRTKKAHRAYYEATFPLSETGAGNAIERQKTGEFSGFLRVGDYYIEDYYILHTGAVRLHPSYKSELAACVAEQEKKQGRPAFIYTDCFDAAKERLNFKPDYAPDTLTDFNYIGNCIAVREDFMDETAWKAAKEQDMWRLNRYLCGRAEENGGVFHIAKPLYEENKQTEDNAEEKADERTDCRKSWAKVSILIPNCDHRADLERCLESVLFLTDYENYEILILENNSTQDGIFAYYQEIEQGRYRLWQEKHGIDIRILWWKREFNYSAINNYGAAQAAGELLVLLNNDTKVIQGNWLKVMAQYALRENTGAVGACLLYPNKTVQHAGIIVGIGPDGTAVHQNAGVVFEERGEGCGIHHVQNCSAVTGACLMVKKKLYETAGGLDEELVVAYNDVDFCLKLRKRGLLNVYVPKALLFHYESVSRGRDDKGEGRRRFLKEAKRFKEKWKDLLEAGDPYYNPNLSRRVPWTLKQ